MKTCKEILIDISGSMADYLPGNKRKIELAKEIVIEKLIPCLSTTDKVGIRLFGGDCNRIYELESVTKSNRGKLKTFVLTAIPEPSGATPLALAITTSVNMLVKNRTAHKEIYLLTDGEDTCGGDVKAAADYAAAKDVKCVINIIALGEMTETAKVQFEYITNRTGGKNINIGRVDTQDATINNQLSSLLDQPADSIYRVDEPGDFEIISEGANPLYADLEAVDSDFISDLIDRNLFDFSARTSLPLNYIPSNSTGTCERLLIIEFYNDDRDLINLIRGLKHVENCRRKNKEVLILMNKWDKNYYPKFFKSWTKQFKDKGVEKVCIKIDGFKSYTEI